MKYPGSRKQLVAFVFNLSIILLGKLFSNPNAHAPLNQTGTEGLLRGINIDNIY